MALNLSNSSSLEQLALKGLIYELDLDILKMCRHTRNVFSGEGFQKLEPGQYRQTDRQTPSNVLLLCIRGNSVNEDAVQLTVENGLFGGLASTTDVSLIENSDNDT